MFFADLQSVEAPSPQHYQGLSKHSVLFAGLHSLVAPTPSGQLQAHQEICIQMQPSHLHPEETK